MYVGPEAKWKYHSPLSESERCGLVLPLLKGKREGEREEEAKGKRGGRKTEEDRENDSEKEKAKRRIEGAGGRDGEWKKRGRQG